MGYLERAQQHVQAAAQIRWRPLYPAPEESLCLKRLLSCDVQFVSLVFLQNQSWKNRKISKYLLDIRYFAAFSKITSKAA